jgi:hypothetical protein
MTVRGQPLKSRYSVYTIFLSHQKEQHTEKFSASLPEKASRLPQGFLPAKVGATLGFGPFGSEIAFVLHFCV